MLNGVDPSVGKQPWRQALEDAIAVLVYVFVAVMIASSTHWPPEPELLYGAGLAALFAAIVAYARARQIQVPPKA